MEVSAKKDSMATQSESLTRLPQLAKEIIRKNINGELANLRRAPSWERETGRSSETIVKYGDFRIVVVRMKPGSSMRQHRADGPISIHLLAGRIRVHLPENRIEEIDPGELLALERCIEHDVEALEESSFLLTIAWRGIGSTG